MASLALGGNGIWGFLGEMDEEGVKKWSGFIAKYKRVREDAVLSYPLRKGKLGNCPEVHELPGREVLGVEQVGAPVVEFQPFTN